MRRIFDKTGEKLFNGVETIRSKGEELNEKNIQCKKRIEEISVRYRNISQKRNLVGKRLEHSFPKLNKLISAKSESLKEQIEEMKTKISEKLNK